MVRQDGTRHQGCDESSGWVWYAARVLEEVIVGKVDVDLRGQRILELGSGTGWLALRLAQRGALVTATDRPGACKLLLQNVYRNQERWAEHLDASGRQPALRPATPDFAEDLNVDVFPLSWEEREQRIPGEWDLIVASDVVYLTETYEAFLDTCLRHGPCKGVLITWEERKPREEEEFIRLAAMAGFHFERPTVIARNPVTGSPIYLLQMVFPTSNIG